MKSFNLKFDSTHSEQHKLSLILAAATGNEKLFIELRNPCESQLPEQVCNPEFVANSLKQLGSIVIVSNSNNRTT